MAKGSNKVNDQKGIVAITITFIFLIVISLTVLALTKIARRESRNELDNRLAEQSYYVAESGVNDAKSAIDNGTLTSDITDCSQTNNISGGTSTTKLDFLKQGSMQTFASQIQSALGNVAVEGEYSCVLVSFASQQLEYNPPVPTDKSIYSNLTMVDSSGAAVSDSYVVFGWQGTSTNFISTGSGKDFWPVGNWTSVGGSDSGALRIDLTDINSLNRNLNGTNTFSAILYPNAGSGTPSSFDFSVGAGTNRGQILNGQCSASAWANTNKYCNVAVHVSGTSKLFLRMKSLYIPSYVTISAFSDSALTNRISIRDAQVTIDSTGKVGDIVKRLLVKYNKTSAFAFPEYAIESVDSICKRMYSGTGTLIPAYYPSGIVLPQDQAICDPTQP